MRNFIIFALLVRISLISGSRLRYWVHESCEDNLEFRQSFVTARLLSRSGLRRLRDGTDHYTARIFQLIFKTTRETNAEDAFGRVESE